MENNVNIIILGDFNLPCYVSEGCDTHCDKCSLLKSFLNVNNLEQCNTVLNHMQRKLDLILSNMHICDIARCENALVAEDKYHPALNMYVLMDCQMTTMFSNSQPSFVYDYAKGDFYLLYHLLNNLDWSDLENTRDVNACVQLFYEKLYLCIEQAIPKKISKAQNNDCSKYPNFFSLDLIRKIKQKNRLHRKIKCGRTSPETINQYINLRVTVKKQTKHELEEYHENIENNINLDPSRFWAFVKDRCKQNQIPDEVNFNNTTFNDPQGVANAFAQYFASVFQNSTTAILTDCQGAFCFSEVTKENIIKSIRKLKPKKATGTDNIPAYIYKGCAELLSAPLALIFNLAIKNNCFPDRFKEAVVSPVFKSGNVRLVENYRPISVLNSVAKIFENVLYYDLLQTFQNYFVSNQHGFLPGRSAVTNLCVLTQTAMEAINNKIQTDVIMTDCAKAFDMVDHGILLNKLRDCGFSGGACNFLESYISMRWQQVRIGKNLSERYVATSGVPQGSNLGPLLFAFFINNLSACVQFSESLLFADDFKIFKTVSTYSDCQQLQCDVDSITQWFKNNRMSLNINKCHVITFTRKINPIIFNYSIEGSLLKRKNECRDLGVRLQSNLMFGNHYNDIVNKAYRALGFIIRNTKYFKRIESVARLYNALVRPHLEYASIIWAPQAEMNSNLIEKVQKRFLRYLYIKKHHCYPYMISYNTMLTSFKFESLSQRRKMHSVLFIYYIINNIKYTDFLLINNIKFNVPKINLRIRNAILFSFDPHSNSPLNNMLRECNLLLGNCDIDLFNTSRGAIKNILN